MMIPVLFYDGLKRLSGGPQKRQCWASAAQFMPLGHVEVTGGPQDIDVIYIYRYSNCLNSVTKISGCIYVYVIYIYIM